jgi:two-component sensor histidine kinase
MANAPGLARQLASDHAHGRLAPEPADEFVLMVSELVGNAVRHGQPEQDGQIGLRLEADDSIVRAVVSDGAAPFSYPTGGMGRDHLGLHIVQRLADRWGLDELDGGKAVWFEVESGNRSP